MIGQITGFFNDPAFKMHIFILADDSGILEGSGLSIEINLARFRRQLIRPDINEQVTSGFYPAKIDIIGNPVRLDGGQGLSFGDCFLFFFFACRFLFTEKTAPVGCRVVLFLSGHRLDFFQNDITLGNNTGRVFVTGYFIGRNSPFFRLDRAGQALPGKEKKTSGQKEGEKDNRSGLDVLLHLDLLLHKK